MRLEEGSVSNTNNHKEVALIIPPKQFKGLCGLCGKHGHKKADCWENKAKSNKKANKTWHGTSKNRKELYCHYCKKKGHTEPYCYIKQNKDKQPQFQQGNDVLLITKNVIKNTPTPYDQCYWIADSGATLHATNSLQGMFDLEPCKVNITVGDGKTIFSSQKGKKHLQVKQPNNNNTRVVLQEVHYVPDLMCNLFSLTCAMSNGAEISSSGLQLTIKKGSVKIIFDQVIKSQNGHLLAIKALPIQNKGLQEIKDTVLPTISNTVETSTIQQPRPNKVNINILHSWFGHANEAYTKATATSYGWQWTGTWEVCEFCALAKSKQKVLVKLNTSPVEKSGGRIYLDISSIQAVGLGGSRFWCLLVDEFTKMKWSFFLKRKSDMVDRVIPFFKDLKHKFSKTVKVIRCDNAGENMALAATCKKQGLGIDFEFTAPGTPQHNGVVERAFATLFGRVRAMLNEAKFPDKLRADLWTECANTATDIDNLIVSDKTSPYQAFHGSVLKFIKKLQVLVK